jgi:hypothetical protein
LRACTAHSLPAAGLFPDRSNASTDLICCVKIGATTQSSSFSAIGSTAVVASAAILYCNVRTDRRDLRLS